MKKIGIALLMIATFFLAMGIAAGVFIYNDHVYAASQEAPQKQGLSIAEGGVTHHLYTSADAYAAKAIDQDVLEEPKVKEALEPKERMVIDISEEDVYMLICQVECEACVEPYDGKVGVANVIINRVKSTRFPNSVPEVLYQTGQFPPAVNGSLDRVMAEGPCDSCRQATMDALYGADAVGSYLFFNMQAGVNLSECRNYMQIGDTIFYTPIE